MQVVEDLKRDPSKDIGPKDIFEIARSHLKNRILVTDSVFASRKAWLRRDRRGGAEFQTAGNLWVVEDLKRGLNKDIGPKDIFEMASKVALGPYIGYNKSRLISYRE